MPTPQRAGVEDFIEFKCQAVSSITPPAGPGWVVTNPPYGVRVSEGKDLRNLYAQFGNVLRRQCPGWNVAVCATTPFCSARCSSNWTLRSALSMAASGCGWQEEGKPMTVTSTRGACKWSCALYLDVYYGNIHLCLTLKLFPVLIGIQAIAKKTGKIMP